MAVKPLTMTGTQERVLTDNQTALLEVNCRHHWMIETPRGSTSLGECKFCGGRKFFPNSVDDALREDLFDHMAVRLRGTTIFDKITNEYEVVEGND